MQKTLVFLKPDVTQCEVYHNIINDIFKLNTPKLKKIKMVDYDMFNLSIEQADEFYADNRGKDHHQRNIDFISSGPVIAFVLEGNNVITELRSLVGCTDPEQAKKESPYTLRAKYGSQLPQNAIHCSDSPESATREIKLLFGY